MTKKDLIDRLQEELQNYSKKDLEYLVNIIFDGMKDTLRKGNRIEIRGFGNFTVRTRKSRVARNPKTGEAVYISESKVPFFKVGKELKKMVDIIQDYRLSLSKRKEVGEE